MTIKCPHCGEDIEVVSAKELAEDFGITSNRLQHSKSKGRFPEPWMSFPNRDVWIRDDVVAFVSRGTVAEAEKAVSKLKTMLATASPEDAQRLLDELHAVRGGR